MNVLHSFMTIVALVSSFCTNEENSAYLRIAQHEWKGNPPLTPELSLCVDHLRSTPPSLVSIRACRSENISLVLVTIAAYSSTRAGITLVPMM